MKRADNGLPFLLQYENVVRYDCGEVIILDRRKYPSEISYVHCKSTDEVARAISDMVTQSGGHWWAAAFGMANAAKAIRGLSYDKACQNLNQAMKILSNARPTTAEGMQIHLGKIVDSIHAAIQKGNDAESAALTVVEEMREKDYLESRQIATYAVDLLPDHCNLLTQCFAETLIGYILLVAKEKKKNISLICPETRPYLQGARLTASVAADMSIPVTVITDNMPGYILSKGMADVFVSAADVITVSGHVINKIGTFQIALAAHHFGVPYYVLGNPNLHGQDIDLIQIEERNPEDVLRFRNIRTTKEGVKGYYPAFDITPPQLVSAVVTSKGVFSPYDLRDGFSSKAKN